MAERPSVWEEMWLTAFRAQGHEPRYYGNGSLDLSDWGDHGGPICTKCGWTTCWWCDGPEKIPSCADELARLAATKFGFDRERAEAEEVVRADERRNCARRLRVAALGHYLAEDTIRDLVAAIELRERADG